ncbi:hypothetical protein K438DRAFT_2021208 [Mycena galopus ATCC 62051]|nr:hypothetical protein K438DRAFT_2021208 [Mycena galopus ATCC 62051]
MRYNFVTHLFAHPQPTRIIRRALGTVSKPIDIPPTTEGVRAGVEKNPCLDFYRTKMNLRPFSCNWDKFDEWAFFTVPSGWHDLTEMDYYVRRVFKITGTIRPLAFLDYYEACIAFEAGGEYYYIDTGSNDHLVHFGSDFTSDDNFLRAFIHRRPHPLKGTIHKFPDTTDLYEAVWREQELRKKTAEEGRQS